MKSILLNESQRKKIVKITNPNKKDFLSYQNLNLLTGIKDEQSKSVLTYVYFLSEGIRRTGMPYNECKFVLLSKRKTYIIEVHEYLDGDKYREVVSPCDEISSDKLLEMMNFYDRSKTERDAMAKEMLDKSGLKRYNFTEKYLSEKKRAGLFGFTFL